jgi:hypothetical protein
MLDSTTIRAQLDTAIEALTATLGDLFAAEMKRRQASAPKVAKAPKVASPPKAAAPKEAAPKAATPKAAPRPKPAAKKAAPVNARTVKPLLGRANVHVVPSQPKLPPATTSLYVPEAPKGPPPEEIAKKAERVVMAASLPPTFERIRRALRVSKNALAPIIDQLVENKKICVVDVGGVILYKPPRIEPIRRRRVDRPAASGQGL